MAKGVKGIIVEIGGDTSGLQKALRNVNSATSSLSKELRGVNSLLKLDPKNTELLAQKQTILNENIDQTKNKLQQLKEIETKAIEKGINKNKEHQENWRALQREIVNTQSKLNQLLLDENGWNVSGKKIEELGRKIENTGKRIDGIGGKLTKTVTPAVFGLGVISGKTAIDFESAFTGVEKTVEGTAEQMEVLKQGIKDMAKEIPASTTEISAVAEAAGQLGIKTEDILSFTRVMIDLGNSTNLNAEEAASALAKFANVTKMSSKDYDRLGATIVALGNNFATTERDIVEMATRLSATGELAGLSEAQILAMATAMSSVGIEAEAGGSAMSKLLKQIQVAVEIGSEDLNDFAKVAGMTSKEFKTAFEKDAVKALSSFIAGLNDTERNGKSAISILDELEIKEVRMSNTILSLANASDVMNNAVDLGNKAWEENSALTNEATKRYATAESKLKTTANRAKNLGITLGDKLLPSFNKILDKVEKWINKLEEMDETTLNNIVKFGLFVTATGPVIKILGKLTSVTGQGIEKIGLFAKKIGELDTKAKTTSSSFTKVTSNIGSFTGKASFVVAGITGIVSALNLLDKAINKNIQKNIEKSKEFIDSMQHENDARKNNMNTIYENLDASLSEINNIQSLRNELSELTDENGKVKEGYEARAKFILNELNNSLGTEYEMTGNVIAQYKNLKGAIDEVIAKKKAQVILEANEENYKEAIKNKTKLYEDYIKTQDELAKKLQEIKDIDSSFYLFEGSRLMDMNKAKGQYEDLTKVLKEQEKQIQIYNKNITDYEKNSELMIKGGLENYKKIENFITEVSNKSVTEHSNNIAQKLANEQQYLLQSKRNYDIDVQNGIKSNDSKYRNNVESSKKNLEQLTNELIAMTSATQTLSPQVVEAWNNLAQNSRDEYNKAISQLPVEMQNRINEITKIVRNDLSVSDAMDFFGQRAVEKVNERKSDFKEAGKNWIKGINEGINDKLTRQEALSSMRGFGVEGLQAVQRTWDEHSPSKETEKLAINFLKGVPVGLKKEAPRTLSEMENIAQKLLNKFNFTNMDNFSDLLKLQSNVTQKINMNAISKVVTPNITINTQQLTAAELDRIVDNVNLRFGNMY